MDVQKPFRLAISEIIKGLKSSRWKNNGCFFYSKLFNSQSAQVHVLLIYQKQPLDWGFLL